MVAIRPAKIPPKANRTKDRHNPATRREYEKRPYVRRKRSDTAKRKLLRKPWLAWDGEGVTDRDGKHRYTLLSAYQTGTVDDEISNINGLSTVECLKFLCDVSLKAHKPSINVIYGGSYDCNMMLKDIPKDVLAWLYHGQTVVFDDYRIAYRQGKSLWVRRETDKVSVMLYDVVSFFQSSFVQACDEYLGTDWEGRDTIISMKAKRGTFTDDAAEKVRYYNRLELQNLIALMETLREHFIAADLMPSRWDGPGAISAKLLSIHNVREAMHQTPPFILEAARHAYAGGRFELLRFGHYPHDVYEYDLNSAYPAALQHAPNLRTGVWVTHDPGKPIASFGVYKVRWHTRSGFNASPLWMRTDNGTIVYACDGVGWYWSPEVESAIAWQKTLGDYGDDGIPNLEILEGYDFIDDGTRPFAFIPELYDKRQKLKAAHDGAHVAIKLALNSLYGKLCQQIGWKLTRDGKIIIPPWHQLEWAGYATSYCRAKVFQASLQNPDALIAFETDALFTTKPLNLPLSNKLGEWEETRLRDITYMSSGFYFATDDAGQPIVRTRGVDKGCLTREQVLDAMRDADKPTVPAVMTRFYTMGLALSQDFSKWCSWRTEPKELSIEPNGGSKRIHWCGDVCTDSTTGLLGAGLHWTLPNFSRLPNESYPYPLEWLDDERCRQMEDYERLRYGDHEYDIG